MLEDSRKDVGRFQGLDPRRNGTEPMSTNRMENGIKLLKACCSTSPKAGHPVFRASSALERGELKSKGRGMKTMHSNSIDETIELILRTIISVNQLSIYGAAADLCKELARDSPPSAGKPTANENLESMLIPTEFPAATDMDVQETCSENTSKNSQNFLNNRT